jgi:putative membrane protein
METIQKPNTNKKKGHVILRDHLAAHRTALANDRTFLAYIRTALTFSVVGVTFIKFFKNILIEIIGWIMIPVGFYIFIKGLIRFNKIRQVIKEEERNPPKYSDV